MDCTSKGSASEKLQNVAMSLGQKYLQLHYNLRGQLGFSESLQCPEFGSVRMQLAWEATCQIQNLQTAMHIYSASALTRGWIHNACNNQWNSALWDFMFPSLTVPHLLAKCLQIMFSQINAPWYVHRNSMQGKPPLWTNSFGNCRTK